MTLFRLRLANGYLHAYPFTDFASAVMFAVRLGYTADDVIAVVERVVCDDDGEDDVQFEERMLNYFIATERDLVQL